MPERRFPSCRCFREPRPLNSVTHTKSVWCSPVPEQAGHLQHFGTAGKCLGQAMADGS